MEQRDSIEEGLSTNTKILYISNLTWPNIVTQAICSSELLNLVLLFRFENGNINRKYLTVLTFYLVLILKNSNK